jgi:two-component system, cell cycle sensor histidine kinase and response regulator CckA
MSEKTIKILLIEDNSRDARLIRESLAEAMQADPDISDFELVRAAKLSTGLKRLGRGDIDAILLDLSLSDSQGLDTLVRLRSQTEVPVVILSNPENKALAVEAMHKGAQDRLIKGQTSGDLLARSLRYAIERARIEAAWRQAEETLQASEKRFRLLYEKAPMAYHSLDRDGCLIEVNQAWLDMLGYSRDDVVGRWFGDFLPPQPADDFAQSFSNFITTGTTHAEFEMVRKDGSRIIVSIDGKIGCDERGGFRQTHCILHDVTERAQTEAIRRQAGKALRESEERYRTLFNRVPVGLCRSTPAGKILAANPAMVSIFGYPDKESLLATNAVDLYVDAKERTRFRDLVEREGTIHNFETQMYRYDGSTVWIRLNSQAVRDANGQTFYEGTIEDITKRKRAEEELRKSEQRYRDLVKNAREAIVVSQDGLVRFVNPETSRMTGYPDKELISKPFIEFVHPDDQSAVIERHRRRMMGEDLPFRQTLRIIGQDGKIVWIENNSIAIDWENKRATLNLISDITERKQAEEALHYRIQFEGLITDISTHFINLASNEIDRGINRALQTIGEFIDVDRSYVFLFCEDGATMNNTHEWCAEGIEPQIQRIKGIPTDAFQWSLERIRRSEVVHIPRVADLPPEASAEKEEFQATNIQSLIMVPIVYGKVALGFLGLDSVRAEREWGQDIIALLRIAGEIFANALERKQAEEALRKERDRAQQYLDVAGVMLVALNKAGQVTLINRRGGNILGYDQEEDLLGKNWFDQHVPPKIRKNVKDVFDQLVKGETEPVEYYENPVLTKSGEERLIAWHNIVLRDDSGDISGTLSSGEDITKRKRAEEALERSEATLRSIFRASPVGIGLVSDRVFQWTNETLHWMLGYAEEELKGQSARMIYPSQEEYERVGSIKYGKIAERGTGSMETRWQRKDGAIIDVLLSSTPIDPADLSKGVTFTALDITERVRSEKERARAEEALRQSKTDLEKAQSVAHVGSWKWNVQTNQLAWSDEMYRIFGINKESFSGSLEAVIAGAIHPEDRSKVEASNLSVIRDKRPYPVEYRVVRSDGSVRVVWAEAGELTLDEASNPLILTGIVQDITERKQAEEERERLLAQIQEQVQRVQQIMDTVPAGVILLDIENHVVLANPLGRRDLAILADTLVGGTLLQLGNRPLAELLTSPPEGLWHELSAEGQTFQVIARPIEESATPKGWVLIIRDITQQREVERRIQQQERLAAVGQLAAGIAHDFNNIMAVITLYAGMSLRTSQVPQKVYERLEIIDQQARRASDLIQQILDFSRRAVLERHPMELMTFLKEQAKLLRRTLPENIQIDLTADEDEYMVNADLTRVQQMIMNLATNARDAMPEGGQLRIGLEKVWITDPKNAPLPEMTPGEWVCVTVADTGSGIPADVLPHIYDPFFTTKPVGSGTGLGLSQVYGIVKQHEGYIDVTTWEGEGTTFAIYLPSLAQRQPETTSYEAETLIQGQGQTILVVEDDAATRAALVDSLELLNYRVIETANGREALAILEQQAGRADAAEQIALVLSDMVMPEMGGRALLHALREKPLNTRIVFLTGHPLDEETFEDLHSQGLQGWLLKPLSIEQLSQTLAQALEEE